MSNLIFPMPAPPAGSWAWPVKKAPSFKSIIQTPASNKGEQRIALAQFPIWMFEYDFSYLKGDYQNAGAMQNLVAFFGKVQGCARSWLFTDPFDSLVPDSPSNARSTFGYGDGTSTIFPLIRQIGGMSDLIQTLNGAPKIYVNGTLQTAFNGSGSAAVYWQGLENLLQQSAAFNLSPWGLGNAGASNPVITPNSTTAPDGTTTADTIAFPSTVGAGVDSYLVQFVPNVSTASESFTFSIWLKCTSGTQQVFMQVNNGNNTQGIGSSSKTVTTTWTRFTFSGSFDSLSASGINVYLLTNNSAAQTVFAWGAQLERWPSATGYLPTTTAQSFPNGAVTFATAPAQASQLTWSGSFYHRCRFDEDELSELSEFLYQIWDVKSLKFRSLLL